MSVLFAKQRVPVLDTLSVLKKIFSFFQKKMFINKNYKQDNYKELVSGDLYHTKKGHRLFFDKQCERLKNQNVNIMLNCKIIDIKKNNDIGYTIQYIDNSENRSKNLNCNKIISTIPISNIIYYLKLSDHLINDAANNLKYKPNLIYGVLIDKTPVLPCMFIYYRDSIFNRVTDLTHFGIDYVPKGHSVVLFEVHCDSDSDIWLNPHNYERDVLNDMELEGIANKNQVVEIHHLKYEHAYPLYDKNFQENYSKVSSHINEKFYGLHLTGRQGLFQFINIHVSVLVAQQTAKKVLEEIKIDNKK